MSAQEHTGQPSSPVNSDTKRVLIVEDNLMNRRLAGFMVKNKGHEFDGCASGGEALLQLRAKKYHLVLMDIEMPGMNGYECTQKIRQELKMNIPVIAMTAHDSDEEKDKCRQAGMDGYISKPMDEGEFTKILYTHLNGA